MTNNFQHIDVSINGIAYSGALGRHIDNPAFHEAIIIVEREDADIAHLESIPLDSIVEVKDDGGPYTFAGSYQYVGGNYRQYIFRLSNPKN
ncbi:MULTISPECIES: hypothetical protein [Pantoea]|uniref:hypothetical protein n=1 Tax=Pantoea TaxID=53335 RepID=UPI0023F53621|nr:MULTISPECIES: hypothetical protein [Pantoea]MDU4128679.1 hypothetical protein [Pantoea sp.]